MIEREIVIFEGPDGAGKSTAAAQYAETMGARLVHCGSFSSVRRNLAHFYVEAMLPALLGYQNVVLDRSWMSEAIYGSVFREGQDRLGIVQRRMLDRVAMRCRTRVMLCLPPVDACLKVFRSRRGEEMLEREDQLLEVHQQYADAYHENKLTSLPVTRLDYTNEGLGQSAVSTTPHPLGSRSAGNLLAQTVLVGESFARHGDADTLFQAPFVAFSRSSCSHWLTSMLSIKNINERSLLWLNADDPMLLEMLSIVDRKKIVSLEMKAHQRLCDLGVDHHLVQHPQHAKRFHHREPYRLLEVLGRD